MKNIYGLVAFGLVVLGLSGKQAAVGQSVPPPNTDPNQVQAIVQGIAEKEGLQGVEFGMWLGDREVLVTALGKSMTTCLPRRTCISAPVELRRPSCPRCC